MSLRWNDIYPAGSPLPGAPNAPTTGAAVSGRVGSANVSARAPAFSWLVFAVILIMVRLLWEVAE